MTDGNLCQYCDEPREYRGWFGTSPVSLCEKHKMLHGRDFDSVTAITQVDVNKSVAVMEES